MAEGSKFYGSMEKLTIVVVCFMGCCLFSLTLFSLTFNPSLSVSHESASAVTFTIIEGGGSFQKGARRRK